ncbi:MAG: glycoside hydrolase family 2 TIM barrel-domain containing protein [Clostridia bacterium]
MNQQETIPLPRSEHPRPDFQRSTYCCLNGAWQFAFDDADQGKKEQWFLACKELPLQITVPFVYQSKASGIEQEDIHPILWYRRSFLLPKEMAGKRCLLRFGAVDYACAVYVNGRLAGSHRGGYTPFSLDITCLLQPEGANDLCLRVEDANDCTQPRGKQYWQRGLMGCWYTPCSGIWQTVYLEAAGEIALEQIHITPDIDRNMATFEISMDRASSQGLEIDVEVSLRGKLIKRLTVSSQDRQARIPVDLVQQGDLDPIELWSPSSPTLYDALVTVRSGQEVLDRVSTYFGMRKIEVCRGQILLNNTPLYQRLILDQGYWPESLLTPPSDEAIQTDIRLSKELGYNGARKHQKIEDPRYYYWADRMGLLVWGEVPSCYDFTDESVANLAQTLLGFIERDFNHPCIITWVPLNESWGVRQIYTDARQQNTARMLYYMAKAADGTRLVSSNDGWEQTKTDICALHDYSSDAKVLARHFASREQVERTACDHRAAYARGEVPTGEEAFMVTEYGGIAFENIGVQGELLGMETWGYNGKVQNEAAFFERFEQTTQAVSAIPYCQGYCYTQLTDVMQEINGVLTPDRQPKVNMEKFRLANHNPTGFPAHHG